MAQLTAFARATGTITEGTISNAETVTVAGKVYTFQTTLTDVNGNVLIGADDGTALDNLAAAIVLGPGAGTLYATAMTVNPHVTAVASGAATNVVTVTAIVPGTIGNLIALAEGTTGATISGALLTTGAGSVVVALNEILAQDQVNATVIKSLEELISATNLT